MNDTNDTIDTRVGEAPALSSITAEDISSMPVGWFDRSGYNPTLVAWLDLNIQLLKNTTATGDTTWHIRDREGTQTKLIHELVPSGWIAVDTIAPWVRKALADAKLLTRSKTIDGEFAKIRDATRAWDTLSQIIHQQALTTEDDSARAPEAA